MNKKLIYATVLICGMALGIGVVSFFDKNESEKANMEQVESVVWTCSMHPDVQQNEPGICSECNMELSPSK